MTGGDLEAFADAAWWGSKLPEALAIRKEAYAAYDTEGNDAAAGATAARLAVEHFQRGEPAVGGGFLMRAQRHVAALPPGREQGFMATLTRPATTRRHTNVLMHMAGHLKKQLDEGSTRELHGSIDEYRRFVVGLAERVAHAHREGGVEVSDAEQAAINQIEEALGGSGGDAPAAS